MYYKEWVDRLKYMHVNKFDQVYIYDFSTSKNTKVNKSTGILWASRPNLIKDRM